MNKYNLLSIIVLFVTSAVHAAPQEYDYNFDGHMDYRVLTVSNARASQFDVFIFNPRLGKHVKDETLSGLIYPYPDQKTKRVNSIFTGGHSGALFTGTVYTWNGKEFEYAFSVKQEAVTIDGQIHYIRVKSKLVDGKSSIFSIEQGDPEWDDKGMSIKSGRTSRCIPYNGE